MTSSTAYDDLGGGSPNFQAPSPVSNATGEARSPHVRHTFDAASGWCRCGLRDDGALAEFSPAWRARQGVNA